jgi:hypothetical protein
MYRADRAGSCWFSGSSDAWNVDMGVSIEGLLAKNVLVVFIVLENFTE